jgi:heme/copper-type cytochrome/quinol oxidase subunit 2
MDESTNGAQPEARRSRDRTLMLVGAVVVTVLTALYTWSITYRPAYGADTTANSAISPSTNSSGQKVYNLRLDIQVEVGVGPHADWLGYQTHTKSPHPGTIFTVPRNSLVTVTIHNFDSATAPRNEFFSLVQGTVGGTEIVNGKTIKIMNPDVMSHTFTIPDFGVSVPMLGVSDTAKPTDFQTMKFTFKTPDRTGVFRWQCIVPCGSGTYGNGGPMGELGYMQGLITLT